MIEKTILDFLNAQLDVTAYMERPLAPPNSYVVLERTGGSISNVVIGKATFAIQAYALSLYAAAQLAHKVISVIDGLRENAAVSDVSVEGLYNFTDTDTKEYRYQVVLRVVYYHTWSDDEPEPGTDVNSGEEVITDENNA